MHPGPYAAYHSVAVVILELGLWARSYIRDINMNLLSINAGAKDLLDSSTSVTRSIPGTICFVSFKIVLAYI